MKDPDFAALLEFAVEAAQLAGSFTLGYFQTGAPHELKADRSPVTAADRGAEELLRARIERAFPDHGILGEEFGEKPGRGPARWILDPVDGTFSFISGVPLFSTLVAFEWERQAVVGVIHMPALRETVYAARGLGCWWNGRRARVSSVANLADARLSVTSAKSFAAVDEPAYRRLQAAVAAERGWADAYGYACLATGRVDVMLDPQMQVWDNAALLPVITEAGGRFTDWSGEATHLHENAVASNGHLHDAVLALLK